MGMGGVMVEMAASSQNKAGTQELEEVARSGGDMLPWAEGEGSQGWLQGWEALSSLSQGKAPSLRWRGKQRNG